MHIVSNISKPTLTMSIFLLLFLTTTIAFTRTCNPLPLSTNGRWIIDESTGNRVKLSCVNWAGHLEPMIIEGLQKQSLSYITDKITSMGFNCVRLTWSTYMFTRQNYSSLTVGQSLDSLGLKDAKSGVAENNPEFLNVTVVDVQKAVVNRLSGKGIMVVLDNHVSKPEWCCNGNDGNGFFGDGFFDPKEWIQGLTLVANQYKGNSNVVGISMRNELRGPLQNQDDWYRYMKEGENAIHKENPSILVIISGLSYDTDLSFLKQKPLDVTTNNKIVYEAHWYSFFSPSEQKWTSDTNALCANQTRKFMDGTGFLIDSSSSSNVFPLFLSEFGVNQSGEHEIDNRYLSCLMALLAEYDMDWGLWALQGSYIVRQGNEDTEEVFGMLDSKWKDLRNSSIQQRLHLVKQISQDFRSDDPTEYILYHPQTGQCIQISNDGDNHLYTTDCRGKNLTRWDRNDQSGSSGTSIRVQGTTSSKTTAPAAGECLSAVGDGSAAVVSSDCSSSRASSWEMISSSKLHIASRDDDGKGKYLCLERNSSSSTVVTRKCLCLDDSANDVSNCSQNPETQWFKFVPTNVNW